MLIKENDFIIRTFETKDAPHLYKIVREPGIVRFMKDWSEGFESIESYHPFIKWMQSKKDSLDVFENKRFVIAKADSDEMIGMVGMGLEESLHEVEMAYFMSQDYQGKGYALEAIKALIQWCFEHSELEYLILTIDSANVPSQKLAEKCGFTLFEKRYPIGHVQANMESDHYYYYRLYRPS